MIYSFENIAYWMFYLFKIRIGCCWIIFKKFVIADGLQTWVYSLLFSYREQSTGKLQEYLAKPSFPLEELLSIPGILADIKMNIGKFIKYLSTRKKLTTQLVYYATRLT